MTPEYWNQATRELAAGDAVLRALIGQHDGLIVGSRGDAFSTLARAIVGQQLSVKAAQSVWNRLCAELPAMRPAAMLAAPNDRLRGCGLSGSKVVYLKDLAARFDSGALEVTAWSSLDDEEVILRLVEVKGIGRWTAEMFLIFYLNRPDVLPLDDLGLQRAMRVCYNRGRALSAARMRKLGATWAPWRSVATWYLWRSLDPLPVQY
ncbi:MAG: DNA-3-methyladenine glycosylase family protein [Betaproteobacteria bacterium]